VQKSETLKEQQLQRFLEEWALPETLDVLRQVFAHYDAEEVWQALLARSGPWRPTRGSGPHPNPLPEYQARERHR
jgi:hypothetical protein